MTGTQELTIDAAPGSGSQTIDVCDDPGCGGPGAPAWSPHGTWLAIVDGASTQLHVVGIDGSHLASFDVHTESHEPITWLPPSNLLTVA